MNSRVKEKSSVCSDIASGVSSGELNKLPDGWEWNKLGDICKVIAGQSPEGKYYNKNGNGLPFYQGKKEFTEKYIGEPTTWTTVITKEAIAGDILLSVRAPVGPVNFSTQKICIGRGLAAIRANESIDSEFLFNFLIKHESEIISNSGAVFNSINKTQIKNILIPIPPLPEQKRIVDILDKAFTAIDKAKENAERNLANARELFESYLNGIFNNPGNNWLKKKIGDISDSVEYGSSSKSKPMGSIPVLRMGNIQNNEIDWSDLVYTDDKDEIQKYLLKKNDVLFNRTNSEELVGKTAIYRGQQSAIFAGYLIRINYKFDIIDPEYLNIWLNWKPVREYGFSVMTSSVNQANINGTKLKEYPIIVPPFLEQRQIVSKLKILSAEIKKLESIYLQKLKSLEELKKSILNKAFCGEL